MKQEGKELYELYLKQFGNVFAPKWNELSEESQENWDKLAWDFLDLKVKRK